MIVMFEKKTISFFGENHNVFGRDEPTFTSGRLKIDFVTKNSLDIDGHLL